MLGVAALWLTDVRQPFPIFCSVSLFVFPIWKQFCMSTLLRWENCNMHANIFSWEICCWFNISQVAENITLPVGLRSSWYSKHYDNLQAPQMISLRNANGQQSSSGCLRAAMERESTRGMWHCREKAKTPVFLDFIYLKDYCFFYYNTKWNCTFLKLGMVMLWNKWTWGTELHVLFFVLCYFLHWGRKINN